MFYSNANDCADNKILPQSINMKYIANIYDFMKLQGANSDIEKAQIFGVLNIVLRRMVNLKI